MSGLNVSFQSMASLKGYVALVTGAGTGIGLMIAKGFVANGAKVYITGRRIEVLKKAAEENGFIPIQMDVTSKDSIQNAVKVIEEAEGKLDILVNNAGIYGGLSGFVSDRSTPEQANLGQALFEKESYDEQWMSVFSTNAVAPFFVTTAFLSLLEKGARSNTRAGETSSVINISSAAGELKLSCNNFKYGATKAALNHLTQTMATEFGLSRIPVRVNAISPGIFHSEMSVIPEEFTRKAFPAHGGMNPAPALRFGRDEDMAMAAIYLASPAGEFVNGIVMRVDGGYSLVNP